MHKLIRLVGLIAIIFIISCSNTTVNTNSGKEFVEEELNYKKIQFLDFQDNSIVYQVDENGENFIVFNGVVIENAYYPRFYDDKLLYRLNRDGKNIIIYDGKEIPSNYQYVFRIEEIDGKIAYETYKDNKAIVIFDNVEYGIEYDKAFNPKNYNEKFSFRAVKDGKNIFYYDGKVYDTINYSDVTVLDNGKMAFSVINKEGKYEILLDGNKIGDSYDKLGLLDSLNNKLIFIADKNEDIFVVYGDEKIGKDYNDINFIFKEKLERGECKNVERIGPKKYLCDNEYIGGDVLVLIPNIKGNELFIDISISGKYFFAYNNKIFGREYDKAFPIGIKNDAVISKVQNGNKFFIMKNHEKITKDYDYIGNVLISNNKLIFDAMKNDRVLIVKEI